MRKLVLSAALAALLSASGAATATPANQVVNGDFETGSFAGWTLTGNTAYNAIVAVGGSHGYVWRNGAITTPGEISQNISTVAGTAYTLSFDFHGTETPNKMKVFFGDDLVPFAQTNFDYPDWTHFTITGLVADSSNSLLKFASRNDPDFNYVDNITLTATVPEAESYAMLLAGLGLMVTIARRRSKSKSV